MIAAVERFIPLFESYLLAEDRGEYLKKITDPISRVLLQSLINPLDRPSQLKEKLIKNGIPSTLIEPLLDFKLIDSIKNAKNFEDNEAFKEIKKRFCHQRFNYSKPTAFSGGNKINTENNQKGSQLEISSSLAEYINEKISKDPRYFKQLTDYAILQLPQATIRDLPLSEREYFLQNCGILFHYPKEFVCELLQNFEAEKRKKSQSYRITSGILNVLTKDQIILLSERMGSVFENSDYIQAWFNHNYAETISKYEKLVQQLPYHLRLEKRQAFMRIVKEVEGKQQYPLLRNYIQKLKSQIMVLDLAVNLPDQNRLIEHLSSTLRTMIPSLNKIYSTELITRTKYGSGAVNMRYILEVDSWTQDKIVEEYILQLLKKEEKADGLLTRLSKYFQQKYLLKLSISVRLQKGQPIEHPLDYFQPSQLQTLKDKRFIKILKTNPKKYTVEDEVKLEVTLKNVAHISIKVYEINLEKHLVSTYMNIADEVDLSFLMPTTLSIYQNQALNPFQVIDTVLNIDIPKAMGVFIVELQADTISSRAVIRKGTIICLDSITERGYQYKFYHLEGKRLTQKDGLKAWIKDREVQLTSDGSVVVEFPEATQQFHLIASMGSYAQDFIMDVYPESYKFQVGYIYNSESFLVGKKAKIVLHGRLNMSGNAMSLQLLQNAKARVTVTNNQDIKTFFLFQLGKWSKANEQVVQFPIQAYTKNINIVVEAQIKLYSKKIATVTHTKDIVIDLGQTTNTLFDFYLQKNQKDQFILTLLGANGEIVPNAEVNINCTINGVEDLETTQLRTDERGQISLGKLNIVKKISAEMNNSDVSLLRVWAIRSPESQFPFNNTIYARIGEEISLPADASWNEQDILLLRTFDKYYSRDQSKDIRLQNGRLKVGGIKEEGSYVLRILPLNKTIDIIAVKEGIWESESGQCERVYDEESSIVYEIKKNVYQNIVVKGVNLQREEDHIHATLNLDLEQVPEKYRKWIRVHAFACNYLNPDLTDLFQPESFSNQTKPKQTYVRIQNSAYFSNKLLSDEGAYVWNRQKEKPMVGNNLEKPSLFLKRILVRETKQNEEQLSQEDQYQLECARGNNKMGRKSLVAQKMARKSNPNTGKGTVNINSHNNFLALSGDTASNLTPNSSKFLVPKGYNNIEFYIITPETAIRKTFCLGEARQIKTNDLRHVGLDETSAETGWAMSRQTEQLQTSSQRIVSRNSQWRTIGLSDIFDFANTKKIKLYDWSNHLLSWKTYSEVKKRQIYDKQCCHELNTFIKFKDPDFFNAVVRRFIKDKVQKTFVDLCLIGDHSVISFATLQQLNKLNEFEKVLLVKQLIHLGQKDRARGIVEAMELEQKANKRSYEDFKMWFDTLINAQEPEEKEKLMKKKKMAERAGGDRDKSGSRHERFQMECAMESSNYNDDLIEMDRGQDQEDQESCMVTQKKVRMSSKKAFVPIESTKQYTERTYYTVKNYENQAKHLVNPSQFWSQLARHSLNSDCDFLSCEFMFFSNPIQFVLAACFISTESSINFDLQNAGENYKITAKSPFLLYVKEVKSLQYKNKFGVLMNQRFFDPKELYTHFEDGTQLEKEVQQFIIEKPYIVQTVVTNTSGTPLELQILLDIPKGSLPLRSHQYTQIVNTTLDPYSTTSYQRHFYIPKEGIFKLYPSNASRGSVIVGKAVQLPPIEVKSQLSVNKLETLSDILRSGEDDQILRFLRQKNIFDSRTFNVCDIYWKLKSQVFFLKVVEIFRNRLFYNDVVWAFGFLHHDLKSIQEFIENNNRNHFTLPLFQYFPYYSSRTHKFANETKSTIRNVQFKETYHKFLLSAIVLGSQNSDFALSLAYYLILQDRLQEAQQLLDRVPKHLLENHQVQSDYMRCFLSMSLDSPNFSAAREIVESYKDYPIESWKQLFDEVKKTLSIDEEQNFGEERITVEYQTQVVQEPNQLRFIIPEATEIRIDVFELDMQLFFSQFPFERINNPIAPIKPNRQKYLRNVNAATVLRSDFEHLKDASVDIYEIKKGLPPKKLLSFFWTNPDIKVKVNQNEGNLQVFLNKTRLPGAYIKVFSKGAEQKFYRDGYTDMNGSFRYALSDLDGIKEFSILILTQRGGLIQKVAPPNRNASF